jgi:hypothetical protein
MMQRRHLLTSAAALALPSFSGRALAQTATVSADDLRHAELLRDMALKDNAAWKLVEALTTEIGARPAGSPADLRAAQWGVAALKGLGLSNARAEAMPIKIWQRGPGSARLVAPAPHPLVMSALGNSIAAPAGGIEAEVAWYPDLATLKADTSGRAQGKIVFIDQKMERARDGRGYGPAVGARFNGAVEAARKGAVALAIRSIGTDRDRVAHTGAMGYDLTLPRIPAFAVSVPDAELIARLHTRGAPLKMHFTLDARSDVEATTHNVIAELPGTDLADEVVLLSGHLDSWDVGQGALDDGAGVAISAAAVGVLAQAAALTGRRPRRTVRVVFFGNEENGFDGARHYAQQYANVKHQLVSESDFGAGRVWRFATRWQTGALPLAQQLAQVLAPLGVEAGGNDGSPGPDAGVLMRRHKWPAIGLSQDGTHYFDVHHTENDTLERVDPVSLTQNVACWAAVAWLAAQAPVSLGPAPL